MGEDNLIEALEEYTKKYKDRPLKVLMGSPAYHAFIQSLQSSYHSSSASGVEGGYRNIQYMGIDFYMEPAMSDHQFVLMGKQAVVVCDIKSVFHTSPDAFITLSDPVPEEPKSVVKSRKTKWSKLIKGS